GEHLLVADDHHVAAEHEVALARRDADRVDVFRLLRDADVAVDRATLLREARLIDDADALALKVRRHSKHATDRHNAGAANAGDDDREILRDLRLLRLRQRGQILWRIDALAALELRAFHRDEGRAEALQAREILVAGGLIDGALAAPLGLQRLH